MEEKERVCSNCRHGEVCGARFDLRELVYKFRDQLNQDHTKNQAVVHEIFQALPAACVKFEEVQRD